MIFLFSVWTTVFFFKEGSRKLLESLRKVKSGSLDFRSRLGFPSTFTVDVVDLEGTRYYGNNTVIAFVTH